MVDFSDRDDVARWLKGKPREVAIVIAARAALRAVPGLGFKESFDLADREVILATFRDVSEAWTLACFPGLSVDSREGPFSVFASATSDKAASDAARAVHMIATSTSADVASLAATAADSAANAALWAANDGQAARAGIYRIIVDDIQAFESGATPEVMLVAPLWPYEAPNWARRGWDLLSRELGRAEEDWRVWIDWYEARRDGRPANEALEIARVMIANEIWEQGPKVVNAEIRRLIEEHGENLVSTTLYERKALDRFDRLFEPIAEMKTSSIDSRPKVPAPLALGIPAQRPAAIEPIWDQGRLTVPKKPVKADLNKKKFAAALSALRAELRELVDDVSAEANIDKRPAEFLRRLVERIPETMPRQDELFRLGHVEAILAGYAKTVDQEWPDFLASRYHAISLQFDRTLRQVPLWREFKRNAAKETLTVAQVADSTSLAREAASALQQGDAASFVDPAIARSLEQLADALPVAKAGEEPLPDAIEAGKELLAADLVESVNNILKPIAEVALTAAGDYVEGFGKGLKKAAKKQGPIDGEKAFKWLRRLVVGGATGAGSFVALSNLIAKFPEAFGWLERILHLLK